jgi:hypothetical protein
MRVLADYAGGSLCMKKQGENRVCKREGTNNRNGPLAKIEKQIAQRRPNATESVNENKRDDEDSKASMKFAEAKTCCMQVESLVR